MREDDHYPGRFRAGMQEGGVMRVLGIDPGLASCGWALLRCDGRKPVCEASGVWTTAPGDGDTAARVGLMGASFGGLAKGVDLVVFEAWSYQRAKGSEMRSLGPASVTVPRVIERMRTLAEMRGIPVLEVAQQTCKAALGVRTKAGVRRAVEIMVDGGKVKTGHAADAIAAGVAGARKWRAEAMTFPDRSREGGTDI